MPWSDGDLVRSPPSAMPAPGAEATASARRPWTATALVIAVAVAPLALAATVLRPWMAEPWPVRTYLSVHLAVEVLVVVVATATFAVQWYAAGARLNDARARFIGAGFLCVALLEVLHVLAFPGMPGLPWLESSTERGIVYWLAARFVTVATVGGAALVPPGSGARAFGRAPLLAAAVGGAVLVVVADLLWISRQPIFFVEGVGLTSLKKALEAAVALLAVAGILVHRRRGQRSGEAAAGDLSAALALTVLSELCFMLYARAHDSFNFLGHVYLLLAAYGVFHALFVDAVIRPYARLGESHTETERLRRHIEGELAVTIRNLAEAKELQEDLLRAVSHDLRTPLQVVLLQSERLARRLGAEGAERELARAITTSGRQMAAMIQDLVDAVHLESGTVELAGRPLALAPLVEETLQTTRGALDTERVRVDAPPDLPDVQADPSRLARVLQNVIGNALKYSPAWAEVTVNARRAGAEVVVTVADRGPGISTEHLPRLFERFYRGAQRASPGGLGLGLYISRLVVEAHGGRIWCDSREGEGTTVSFTLPVAAPAAAPARAG